MAELPCLVVFAYGLSSSGKLLIEFRLGDYRSKLAGKTFIDKSSAAAGNVNYFADKVAVDA